MTVPRTIIISDAHGYPELIRNALTHSGFCSGEDVLVYAGDFVHRGPAAAECVSLVEGSGRLSASPLDPRPGDVVILWGNHDVAVLLGTFTYPNSPPADELRSLFRERFASGAWHLAAWVDGALVTHAGVSTEYAPDWDACGRDPTRLATRLAGEFRNVVAYLLQAGAGVVNPPILGNLGPLGYRPSLESRDRLLPGLVQVAGHTPGGGVTARSLRASGVYLVDPDVLGGLRPEDSGRYRYAVIEGGIVRIEESAPPDPVSTPRPRGRR
ncbi:MAG TPA: metallophosphoesterase [Thermoleophilia bacterium]|nr:metallophosphoesterase [Thermoleophilia bacterium]